MKCLKSIATEIFFWHAFDTFIPCTSNLDLERSANLRQHKIVSHKFYVSVSGKNRSKLEKLQLDQLYSRLLVNSPSLTMNIKTVFPWFLWPKRFLQSETCFYLLLIFMYPRFFNYTIILFLFYILLFIIILVC